MMKKLIALFLCLMLALPAAAALADDMTTEITLWTFPVGGFGDDEQVQTLIADFNAVYPNIKVNVEYLDYTNGDVQVTTAMEAKTTPDLIFEGPERLVAVYAAAKALAPLDDLWTEEAMADISAGVAAACKAADGVYYEYPLCSTAHCMVIDKAAFEKADALQYIDMEKHTWTTEGFEAAMAAIKTAIDNGTVTVATPGIVYCGAQGGDQGTRALVNNLYSDYYVTEDGTSYNANSANNVKALTLLQNMVNAGSLSANASYAAADELQAFANQTCAVSFCWNFSNYSQYADQTQFTPFAMAFPSDDGTPELEMAGPYGFGIFDNKDQAKIDAAKKFIDFMCSAEGQNLYAENNSFRVPTNTEATVADGLVTLDSVAVIDYDAVWAAEHKDEFVAQFEANIASSENLE